MSSASAALAKALAAAQKINATPGFDEPITTGSLTVDEASRPFVSEQASKHARKIYVGGLPAHSPIMNDDTLGRFFNEQLERLLPVKEPGDVVVACFLGPDRRYAFIEHRSIPEASFTLSLDGVYYEGVQLKLRRPQDYNSELADQQTQRASTLNAPGSLLDHYLREKPQSVQSVSQNIISTTVEDGPNKIFIGGLPHTMTDDEVKDLLVHYGPLKGFHLVKEKDAITGENTKSKGFAFCEWRDPAITEVALANLNGRPIGAENRVLTVRRALPRHQNGSVMVDPATAEGHMTPWLSGGLEGTLGAPLALTGASHTSALMLTYGGDTMNRVPRYGHMGNLGYEAVSAYLAGRLPFQGSFKPVDPHVEGMSKEAGTEMVGFDDGIQALFPGEGKWLAYREALNRRMTMHSAHNVRYSGQSTPKVIKDRIEEESAFRELRKELWTALSRAEVQSRFGKPSRAVALKGVIKNAGDLSEIQRVVHDFKELVDTSIGSLRYAVFVPSEGGILVLEMASVADAYRAIRSLDGRRAYGRDVLATFIDMPIDVKQTSLLRIRAEIDYKNAASLEERKERQLDQQKKANEVITRYHDTIQSEWIEASRAAVAYRRKEKERTEQLNTAVLAGASPEEIAIIAQPVELEGPDPMELFGDRNVTSSPAASIPSMTQIAGV